ncbi:MAG TPA: hypothetical protein VHR86_05350 [Armatimonadota bacterium]|nr:hypothetical protein [Armatimonadota bacterium]
MKLLTIIYDNGIEEAVMEEIDSLHLEGWTHITNVVGFGGQGLRRGDQIFPGTNNILLIALPEERIPEVQRHLRQLQSTFRLKPGITILVQPVEILGDEVPEATR